MDPKTFIEKAVHLATKAPGACGGTFRFGCLLVKRKRIVSWGVNSGKTHPVISQRYIRGKRHAEVDCLIRYGLKNSLEGLTLIIVRIRPDGSWALARPCPQCYTLLTQRGLADMWYTIGETYLYEKCF